ncbi:phosphatidate cytidylyltransferase [Pseudalkalibacillus berkeleyi]|uniref:Phosphatidate cytidylyltransferase n=1 Tax=Pseudalkalibacillus berkeleyi TaxID=1069813 RepID=A0ABS9H0G5_9BACL|nr:phosphatidate cytidylyltransferase [Pseudalkalibacillus berkeleyi]MCF6137140.1 phosphatidate cytidylyltransferase [Pseudalkalibacillus berkeleyi]
MKVRIITGVLAALIFLPIVFIGGVWFYSIMALLAAIGLKELLRMKDIHIKQVPGLISLAMVIVLVIPKDFFDLSFDLSTIKINTIIIGLFALLTWTVITKNQFTFEDTSFVILSSLYVGIGFLYFNETRALENGVSSLFFVLFIVWATDSGAYFFGKSFGKRKLWPVISPNKTIEGSIGGLVSGILLAVIFQSFFPIYSTFIIAVVAAIVIGIFGQIGDLVESAFKRHYEVKDSGTILPGHGGILDRFDSILFVLPILHLVQLLA